MELYGRTACNVPNKFIEEYREKFTCDKYFGAALRSIALTCRSLPRPSDVSSLVNFGFDNLNFSVYLCETGREGHW